MDENPSLRDKFRAIYRVGLYRPATTAGIIVLSVFAAVLEGIGLSFLLPIIEVAQSGAGARDAGGLVGVFVTLYDTLGIPFELGFIVAGVGAVMVLRYTSSFLVAWLRASLRTNYVRHLQTEAFDATLDTRVAYFDQEGSDDILNAIVTQAKYAGWVVDYLVRLVQETLLSLMYLGIALYLAPTLTIVSAVVLGGLTLLIRGVIQSGYAVGDRVADANERVQQAVQAGTQGIRDVKLFGMADELRTDFQESIDQFARETIRLRRNEAAMDNAYQLGTALTVFGLIYAALEFTSLSLGGLGVFLFAMFRLAPRVSTLNNWAYKIEGRLPHLVRTQQFTEELDAFAEPTDAEGQVPERIDYTAFENVAFEYATGERVLDGVHFGVDRGEFVAFVGPSGAGKSTIVSLLTRLYEPTDGQITADGIPIDEFDVREWRSRVAVVRQQPFIFNDTLRYNVTIGNREASDEQIERVCEIAQVTEFLDDLPNGYDTELGDDGVRLSGGQRQRVAIARALLTDADLLVLDEATSDLDSNIEETVHEAIEAMDRDYAMLVIAHRLSTVINADQIYTVVDGEIVESGSHQELLAEEGEYASLYQTQ
ncbi:ABC transporter ATP-binding protein [Halapricum salinum]|uniref:ABC transporter ATP-binding protein n=1 Tax=Halapricum salinum TaxID=1457250 RepID=A0A4D6HF26_9EURY|nr:ABC transporter ATP-binding protein [Halapricum salinum]QCC51768.1 ABC transporter ATP-binding protein [Halapricum salinum]